MIHWITKTLYDLVFFKYPMTKKIYKKWREMQEIETQLELVGSNWVLLTTNCARILFFKIGGGASPAFFYFCPCLKTMTNLTLNGRSRDGVIGIRTWDRSMAGEDESSKLWRAPLSGPCVAENYSNLVNTLHSIIWVVSFHSSAK